MLNDTGTDIREGRCNIGDSATYAPRMNDHAWLDRYA